MSIKVYTTDFSLRKAVPDVKNCVQCNQISYNADIIIT